MTKTSFLLLIIAFATFVQAQDSLYFYKNGQLKERKAMADVDSITFNYINTNIPDDVSIKLPHEGGDGTIRTSPTDITLLGAPLTGVKVSSAQNARTGMGASSSTTLDLLLGTGSGQLRLESFLKTSFGWKQSNSDTASIYYFSSEKDEVYNRYNTTTKKWNWGTWAIDSSSKYIAFNLDASQNTKKVMKVKDVTNTKLNVKVYEDKDGNGLVDSSDATFYGYDPTRLSEFAGLPDLVKDIDGNSYPTVRIGTQTWMAENLRTTKYNDGTSIPLVSDSITWANNTNLPMMCWYNNDEATYTANKFGALYNWFVVDPIKGSKNVCPIGWHIPSGQENTIMELYLGQNIAMSAIADPLYFGSIGYDNRSKFTAVPSGYRENTGLFRYILDYGYWWTKDQNDIGGAFLRGVMINGSTIEHQSLIQGSGASVRCIKD